MILDTWNSADTNKYLSKYADRKEEVSTLILVLNKKHPDMIFHDIIEFFFKDDCLLPKKYYIATKKLFDANREAGRIFQCWRMNYSSFDPTSCEITLCCDEFEIALKFLHRGFLQKLNIHSPEIDVLLNSSGTMFCTTLGFQEVRGELLSLFTSKIKIVKKR